MSRKKSLEWQWQCLSTLGYKLALLLGWYSFLSMLSSLFIWLRNLAILGIFLVISLSVYATKIEPNWFQVVPIDINVPKLASSFEGFKIVQISDIHADDSMTPQKLSRIVKIVDKQEPDIIAITGDFFTRKPNKKSAELLKNNLIHLLPKEKTVAVLGNHDHYYNPQIMRKILKQSNVLELENSVYTVHRGEDVLSIAGVDDYWKQKARIDLVMEKLPAKGAAVIMAHEPDFADISAKSDRFALQMSGHSHGGQVRLPFFPPPVLPALAKKYPIGRYQVGNMVQYTNRGIGMGKPLIRFAARPEITVFTLSAS